MSGKAFKRSPVYIAAERRAHRLRQIANDAAKKAWEFDNAMRAVYHARSLAQLTEALQKLAELNDSYDRPPLFALVCH